MKVNTLEKHEVHCGATVKSCSINCESIATTGVYNPICRVADYVLFYDGICPYSGCRTCKECAPTKLDEKFLIILATSAEYLYQA